MDTLESIAFSNIKFLQNKDDFLSNKYSLKDQQFCKCEDTFDTIYSFKELEYPIYFTFHQLMNHVHSSYTNTFEGHTRSEILLMLEDALDTIYEYYNNVDEQSISLEILLDDLDRKVSFIRKYYVYGWCVYLPTIIKEYINHACRLMLQSSRTIVKDYIQEMKDPGSYSDEEDNEEGTEEEGTEEEEEDDHNSSDESNMIDKTESSCSSEEEPLKEEENLKED